MVFVLDNPMCKLENACKSSFYYSFQSSIVVGNHRKWIFSPVLAKISTKKTQFPFPAQSNQALSPANQRGQGSQGMGLKRNRVGL